LMAVIDLSCFDSNKYFVGLLLAANKLLWWQLNSFMLRYILFHMAKFGRLMAVGFQLYQSLFIHDLNSICHNR
jgi:hypothetical protein